MGNRKGRTLTGIGLLRHLEDGGVDELFAPRTHTVRVARSKALTRPQRKVMADVMASMQQNPRDSLHCYVVEHSPRHTR